MRTTSLACLALAASCAAPEGAPAVQTPSEPAASAGAGPQAEPDDPGHGRSRNVAVLVFEGVELLDFAGPVEVFTSANGWDEPLRVYTVGEEVRPLRTRNQVVVVPDHALGDAPPPDVLVIPGGETRCLDADRPLGRYVLAAEPGAEIVMSVCNGAFCLADAGLLDGPSATTHRVMLAWLRESAPRTLVRDDVRFVDNGHIVTAAGVSAGIDGALHLVQRLLGPECARQAAARMQYEWTPEPEEAEPGALELARRAWYCGDWRRAAELYAPLAAERPRDAVALERLGTALLFTGRAEEALAPLESSVRLGRGGARPHQALAFAHARLGRHAESAQACERALALDPSSAETRMALGLAQVELARYREGADNLAAAWAANAGDARLLAALARAQAALGLRDEALATLAQAVEADASTAAEALPRPELDGLRGDARFLELSQQAAAATARE